MPIGVAGRAVNPAGRSGNPAWRAENTTGRAGDPAWRVGGPAGGAGDPVERAVDPAWRAEDTAGLVGHPTAYRCLCDIEFVGTHCEHETPCNAHGKRCYNDGVCVDAGGGAPRCLCQEGYRGFRCQNFNPCAVDQRCSNGGVCEVRDDMQRPRQQC